MLFLPFRLYISNYRFCKCSIGPKKIKCCVWNEFKEMNWKKWIQRNEKLETWISRKKIVLVLLSGITADCCLKVRSIAFFLAFFFFLSLSNVFFLYHSFPPCTLASVRRKGSSSSSWWWRRRFYRRPVDVYCISRIAMTGWALYDMRRAASTSVETCSKTCLELLKSRYFIFLYSDLMESIRRFLEVRCSPVEQ